MSTPLRIAVIGGGAAGFFGAVRCAELDRAAEVTIFESTAHPLAKVRVSGGGRCNVTHACFEPRELVTRYPRGGRELLGPLHRFGPRETVDWFQRRGVALKTEADGRMFPTTDDSATIVACLQDAATAAGVNLRLRCGVTAITRAAEPRFQLTLSNGETLAVDRVLLAAGGNKASAGWRIAEQLGHAIEPPVPSLFTFHIDDPRLRDLAGLSVPEAVAAVRDTKLRERGPVLVTHWGLSGPAILKLSAWGARELHARDYRFPLVLNWVALDTETVFAALQAERAAHPRRRLTSANPWGLPARLWERLAGAAGVRAGAEWGGVSNPSLRALAREIAAGEFQVAGKSMNKEEFVTCGGVRLREVDFRTMESRVCPGLHFAGEILDLDGVTGGFNFQAAWTTAWIAGAALTGAPPSPASSG